MLSHDSISALYRHPRLRGLLDAAWLTSRDCSRWHPSSPTAPSRPGFIRTIEDVGGSSASSAAWQESSGFSLERWKNLINPASDSESEPADLAAEIVQSASRTQPGLRRHAVRTTRPDGGPVTRPRRSQPQPGVGRCAPFREIPRCVSAEGGRHSRARDPFDADSADQRNLGPSTARRSRPVPRIGRGARNTLGRTLEEVALLRSIADPASPTDSVAIAASRAGRPARTSIAGDTDREERWLPRAVHQFGVGLRVSDSVAQEPTVFFGAAAHRSHESRDQPRRRSKCRCLRGARGVYGYRLHDSLRSRPSSTPFTASWLTWPRRATPTWPSRCTPTSRRSPLCGLTWHFRQNRFAALGGPDPMRHAREEVGVERGDVEADGRRDVYDRHVRSTRTPRSGRRVRRVYRGSTQTSRTSHTRSGAVRRQAADAQRDGLVDYLTTRWPTPFSDPTGCPSTSSST